MNVVITGANGFVGRALAKRLLDTSGTQRTSRVTRLTLVDLGFDETLGLAPGNVEVRRIAGDLDDAATIAGALSGDVHAVFHLASVPGGTAEREYELGRRVNLDATLALLEGLRSQLTPPRFVFASSVAVYGAELPALIDEQTLPAPALTYGAHKLIGEYLVADASRKGWVEGCSLRLPGVVARPQGPSGLISAFMSDLFWQLRDGEPIVLPVSPAATAWWISVTRCVENLIHAATIDPSRLNANRSYALPVLRLSMAEVVEALVRRFGEDRRALVSHAPVETVERLFGAYPPLLTPGAEALGFRHDGSADALVGNAMV